MLSLCKARYAVLFQIWTSPYKPEDEAHIGPTATYDEVIYPGFQHDITALHIQGYTISLGWNFWAVTPFPRTPLPPRSRSGAGSPPCRHRFRPAPPPSSAPRPPASSRCPH